MKLLHIHYQTNRNPMDFAIYYPEDGRTPNQRLELVKRLSGDQSQVVTILSACPYIIEAAVKLFKDRDIHFYIDNKEVDSKLVFYELARPMRDLTFL